MINKVKSKIRKTLIRWLKIENQKVTKAWRLLEEGYGHKRSRDQKESVDREGNPLPWFTYPAIDYLKQLDLSKMTMLEWGSGNSSAFFSKRVSALYSVEGNEEWFGYVRDMNLDNQTLVLAEADYAVAPLRWERKFDIVLIDGAERQSCAQTSAQITERGGIIILDNSDRYPDVAKGLRDRGYLQVDFHGFGPINNYTWTTSIFFDRSVNIEPIDVQPVIPIGGGY